MKSSETRLVADMPSNRFWRRIASLRSRAGRARVHSREHVLDQLEARFLLGGDHPSFALPLTPTSGTEIIIDGVTGVGTLAGNNPVAGQISPDADDDLFRFVAPATDFVSVRADTVNVNGSTLDSRVEIYDANGALVASGSNNGTLSGGTFKDGWAGFIATSGSTYYIRVRSDVLSGAGATGGYIVRVDAIPTALTVDPNTGVGTVNDGITTAGNDIVYKFTTGSSAAFDSLATVGANQATTLDPRLDLYNASGTLVVGDSQSGRLNDAFAAWRSAPSTTFYLRVRGDEFLAADPAATGNFAVVIRSAAGAVTLDPVARVGSAGGAGGGSATGLHRFQAQGTGLSIVTLVGVGLVPMPDPALRLYDNSGTLIAFNDDFLGVAAEIQIRLVGGQHYFVVAEDFDDANAGTYTLGVESNHTFDTTAPVDDHANTPATGDRRLWERATPVVWSDILGSPGAPLLTYTNPAPTDVSLALLGRGTGRIHNTGDTDLFVFVPPVDMLGGFAGKDDGSGPPAEWLANHRPSRRVQILLDPAGATSFLTAPAIRVFDSNFNVVDVGGPVAAGLPPAPLSGTTRGWLDPQSFPPEVGPLRDQWVFGRGNPFGFRAWGGEAYFIEVAGTSTGRYNFTVQVDAMPAENPNTGFHEDHIGNNPNNSLIVEGADAGEWAGAQELRLANATGDVRNPGGEDGIFDLSSYYERVFEIGAGSRNGLPPGYNPFAAGSGIVVLQESGLAGLETIDDTDLYFFTANADGTAEIRINTSALADTFGEFITDGEDDPLNPTTENNALTKTYNSWLDSALRIFNNDFVQIAYNDDNAALGGDSDVTFTGEFAGKTFLRRDARVVFNVKAGERYFIQVESGQAAEYNAAILAAGGNRALADFSRVDFRHVLGSYELLVNTMPNLTLQVDDHTNDDDAQSTVMIFDDAAGTSSITGIIDNVPIFNPADSDAFTLIAPASGVAQFTLTRGTNSNLLSSVEILDTGGQTLAQGNSNASGQVNLSLGLRQGERVFIVVRGSGGSEGAYQLAVSGLAYSDDHASVAKWGGATNVPILDFLGTGNATGSIEAPGDTDVFRFTTPGYDFVTVTVTGTSPGFDAFVTVYEVGIDTTSTQLTIVNPILLRVAFNDNQGVGTLNAQVSFPTTATNRTPLNPNQANSFNHYYIVVSGADPETISGTYQLSIAANATDDHADAGEYPFATTLVINPETGDGEGEGILEISGDSDLFQFTAPAGGFLTVAVTSPSSSTLRPRISIFNASQQPVLSRTGQTTAEGSDSSISSANFTFLATRGQTYFLLVEGVAGGTVTNDTGFFTVDFNAPTIDDHANITEFTLATEIPLSITSGDGLAVGTIGVIADTDMFFFETLAAGSHVITITTPSSDLNPRISRYNTPAEPPFIQVVDGDSNDQDGARDGSLQITITAAGAGERYYLLVDSDLFGFFQTGAYTVAIDGQAPIVPPFPGNDDHANAGQFNSATAIVLDGRTGDKTASGRIELAGDSDLFKFSTLAAGRIFVQVVTPAGTLLDAQVRIFDTASEPPILVNAEGIPGANAYAFFDVSAANQIYYIEVDGLGSGTGSYTVRIDAEPETFYLYMAEGYASNRIREYVSIANPSLTQSVGYTVTLYYEDEALAPVVLTPGGATLAPGSRGGLTISNAGKGTLPGVVANKPYSLVITSDGFLGANFSHYDQGFSLGEPFTGRTSNLLTIARAEKNAGTTDDFIVFFNPNSTAVTVTLTAYTASGEITLAAKIVQGNRRGGWRLNDVAQLPNGVFSVRLTSAPVNSNDAHIGITAALSHYGSAAGVGYLALADADGGSIEGVVNALTSGSNITPEVVIFNPGNSTASVTIVGSYIRTALPDLTRVVDVAPKSNLVLNAASLGLTQNQPVGLRYTATSAVTVQASEARSGDAAGFTAATVAATSWFFGDAFINTASAGSKYLEVLTFHNPASSALPVTVTFLFSNGTQRSITTNVAANSFASVDVHTLNAVLEGGGLKFFSIQASAVRPFVASLVHSDLFLGGIWGSVGAPLGLTNSLSTIA